MRLQDRETDVGHFLVYSLSFDVWFPLPGGYILDIRTRPCHEQNKNKRQEKKRATRCNPKESG